MPKSKINELAERLERFEQAFQKTTEQNDQLARENAALRQQLDAETTASVVARRTGPSAQQNTFGEVYVGIRNCSDTVVGIPPSFPGDPAIQLNADFGNADPGRFGIVSYATWRELRKGDLVGKGIICRDDSVLTGTYLSAPADRTEDLHKDASANLVADPVAWIEERTEKQLVADIDHITSEVTLHRLQRVVTDALRVLEATMPRETIDQQEMTARKALIQLPAKYRLVDQVVSGRLGDLLPTLPDVIRV